MDQSKRTDLELLGIVIGVSEANELYRGRVAPLFEPKETGSASHLKLTAAHELVKRSLTEELEREAIFADGPRIVEYLRTLFGGREDESFFVLFLDSQCRLIAAEEMSSGSSSYTWVYPRKVVHRALDHNASAVLLAHSHPGHPAEPTEADRSVTTTLQQALSPVEVEVLDHIVIGENRFASFVENGWL